MGRTDEAVAECREAVRIRPGFAKARHSLGVLLLQQGDAAAAEAEFAEALRFEPEFPGGRYDLAAALLRCGRAAEALAALRSIVDSEPSDAAAHNLTGQALAETGDLAGAVASFRAAVRLDPENADFHLNLGLAQQQAHQPAEAAAEYRECLRLQPNNPPVLNALAWLQATSSDDGVRNGTEAVRLAEQLVQLAGQDSPEIVDTLAAAYAESGRYDEALQTARRALELAEKAKQTDLVKQIQDRIKLYGAGRPYRE
jgi:protein O-mannosyl-transferase